MDTILLIYSILPVYLIGLYIYNKDKNKEPTNLLIKLLLGGIISASITVIITLLLSLFIDIFNADFTELTGINLFIYAFICVALIEEISKWIMLYKISYNNREYDETYDMLLYGGFIGLGFACIENIIYVLSGGLSTAILRSFTAVPMHATLGIFMGYYLDKSKKESSKKIISILIPILIHGTYDYCIMQGSYFIISIIILIISLIYSIKLIKDISNKSIKTNSNNINFIENYCPNCGTKYELKYCKNCGKQRI